MALSQFQYVVVVTTALIAITRILSREIDQDTSANDVWNDPVWKNWTIAVNATRPLVVATAENASLSINGTHPDTSVNLGVNSSSSAVPPQQDEGSDTRKYYLHRLPQVLLVYALLVPLQYYWNILLERCLPTRPRGRESTSRQQNPTEKPDADYGIGDADGSREEEIVKKWIAQGKVKRSSISVCNTLSKWILDITVGKVIYEIVFHAVDALVHRDRKMMGLWYLLDCTFGCMLGFYFSLDPVVRLIGFILVPAHQRVVFCAGMEFVISVFFRLLWRLAVPWAIKTDFIQERLKEMTENAWEQTRKLREAKAAAAAATAHRIDEL